MDTTHSGGQTPETSIRDTDAGPEGAAVFLHPRLEYRSEPRPPTLDDRPGLERCIDYLRDHDELIVASIDRLARSLVDLRGISDLVFPREIILWAVRWYCRYKVSYQDFVGEMVGRGVPVEQRAIYR